MSLYRVLEPLSKRETVYRPGQVLRLEWLKPEQVEILVQKGAVSRLQPPPLHVLPGWKLRAAKLQKQGVTNVEQFLEMDSEELAGRMEVQPKTIEGWKAEAWTWLVIPEPIERG